MAIAPRSCGCSPIPRCKLLWSSIAIGSPVLVRSTIEAALAACGRKLVVVDQTEMKDDLVQDMVDVLTSFCARLYGRRAAKNRAAKALAAAQGET